MLVFKHARVVLLTFALTGAMAIPAHAQQSATAPRPAKVWIVKSSEQVFQRQYPAIVEPSQEAVLSFRVSGRVIDLPARASVNVKAGDVIARLDPRDFETNLAQLQSQIDQANAQLQASLAGARPGEIAALQAGIAAVQAQVTQAEEQVERTRTLAERGVVADARLEQDEAAVSVAEAELRAKMEELEVARSGARAEDIEASKAAIRGLETQAQTARDNLADATLRAPFDGIIARRDIENFTNIQAGQDIVLLQKLSTINLVFDVPGPDVVAFSYAEEVTPRARLNALPDMEFDAELVEFSTQADVTTQTYRGRVAVTIPEGVRILPGMIGKLIASSQIDKAPEITIPLTAIGASADGAPFVWLVDVATNAVTRTPVALGDASGTQVIVTNGLTAGDTVVSAGVSRLLEGMVIRPVTRIGG